jgi:hypothetical protein
MSQSTLADDDLFGEAATEMRADVEDSLAAARDALPDADAVWEIDADNTLGVLNGLKTALDVGDAAEHLRDAKKWYTMGERADAFEDAEDLEAEIEDVAELIETVEDAHGDVADLTATVPELRGALEDVADAADVDDATDADGGDEPVEAE